MTLAVNFYKMIVKNLNMLIAYEIFFVVSIDGYNSFRNMVVEKGSQASFSCKTQTFGHGIHFYYQRYEGLVPELLSEIQFKNEMASRLRVETKRLKNWWIYTLVIKNVKFYDFGVYQCFNTVTKKYLGAILAVVGKPECESLNDYRIIRYSCYIIASDYFKIDINWKCNSKHQQVWSSSNAIQVSVPGKDKRVLVYRYVSNVTLDRQTDFKTTLTCNCTMVNSTFQFPAWIQNIDKTFLSFRIELKPVTNVHFNVSSTYNLVVEESVLCHAPSNISVKYLIIKSNNETTSNNIVKYNHPNQTFDMICYASNGLNLEPAKTSISNLKSTNIYLSRKCTDYNVENCFKEYFYYIEKSGQFLRLQKSHYEYLCDDLYKQITSCFLRVLPCKISREVASWIESLYFLCEKDYLKHREDFYKIPLLLKCQTVYPQQLSFLNFLGLTKKFIHRVQLNESLVADELIFNMCINLANQINLYCTTVATRIYGSLNASHWHFEYFARLKSFMLDIKSTNPHFPAHLLETSDCREQNLYEENNNVCNKSYICFNYFETLLSIYNFGIICILDPNKFQRNVCLMTPAEESFCINEFLIHCTPYLLSVFDPLVVLRKLLCVDLRIAYNAHHICLENIFKDASEAIKCSKNITEIFEKFLSTETSKLTNAQQMQICVSAINFLDCIQDFLTQKCGVTAALLQRKLNRLILARGMRKLFCYHVFSHRSIYMIKSGAHLIPFEIFVYFFLILLLVNWSFQ